MKNRLTNLSVVKKSPDQVACNMSGEAVVLNMKSGMYYGTDQIGVVIWNLLDQSRAVKELRDTILQKFQVDADQCEKDLITFLSDMEDAGLIEIQDGIETEKS